jgi:DNA-binding Xre family transcriptional regulator
MMKASFLCMPVKNQLKDVLFRLLGEEITPAELKRRTGIGHATSLRVLKNPDWYPDRGTAEAICRAFGLQPGDWLVYYTDEGGE